MIMKTDAKKISLRTVFIVLVLALAAFTLVYASFNSTLAVLSITSGNDTSTLQFRSSGISLSMGDLSAEETNGAVVPGHTYSCSVTASNESTYDAYMRIIVTKYWTDKEGNRVLTVDPGMIELSYGDEDYNSGSWKLDPDSVTTEQAIYYFKGVTSGGTADLFDGVTIDPAILDEVTETGSETTWDYGELILHVDAEAQLVQAEGRESAQLSAWGVALAG